MATGHACFHGKGAINIPRFSNAYLGNELEVSVTFKAASGSGPDLRAIVYNGDDCELFDPSIVIAASDTELEFVLRNECNYASFVRTYIDSKVCMPVVLLVLYDNALFNNLFVAKIF
ncbi:hypothetical protein DPMN_102101 [Dreissena polymorpha]|uniref:Uncharacterized protein n=1 Tax=Dreissena polymorpha TaxID=45954 RepID=A0A9D4R8W6_DREPO|nr:hypothetical protein DPMN_102101 [Dreissena polymorpha]